MTRLVFLLAMLAVWSARIGIAGYAVYLLRMRASAVWCLLGTFVVALAVGFMLAADLVEAAGDERRKAEWRRELQERGGQP